MNRHIPYRRATFVAFCALFAVAAVACSSSDDAKVVDQSTTSSTVSPDDDGTTTEDDASEPTDESDDSSSETGSSADLTLSDDVEVSSVTCSNSGTSLGDEEAAEAGEVDCAESHDSETISITGAVDLDDCYRAIAAFSDVVILLDEDGEFDIDDERVNGHSFGGYDGEYECQISLAEARTEPLIDR